MRSDALVSHNVSVSEIDRIPPLRRTGLSMPRLLALSDVVALTMAFLITELTLGVGTGRSNRLPDGQEYLLFALSIPVWVFLANLHGLYNRDETRADHGTVDDIGSVVQLVALGGWALVAAAWVTGLADPYPVKLVMFGLLAVCLITVGRGGARAISRRQTARLQRVLVIGAGYAGQLVAQKILSHPEYGLRFVGFVDNDPRELTAPLAQSQVLSSIAGLGDLAARADIQRVIVAYSQYERLELQHTIDELRASRVQVDILPRLYDSIGMGSYLHTVEGLTLVGLSDSSPGGARTFTKRAVDLILATVGLAVLAPIFGYIALRVKLDTKGPIFYRHLRVGQGGREFGLYKFRTMQTRYCRGKQYGGEEAERAFADLMNNPKVRQEYELNFKLHDDPRVTKYGAVLRRRSLDELPQLINVFLGQVSLVGPRPVTIDELKRYGSDREALLSVRPGITGYWQINGRSLVTYEERVRLDRAYVDGWSFKSDMLILAKTVRVILSRSGAF